MTAPKNFLLVNRENLRSPGEAQSIVKVLWVVMRLGSLICVRETLAYFKDPLRKEVLNASLLHRNRETNGKGIHLHLKSVYM